MQADIASNPVPASAFEILAPSCLTWRLEFNLAARHPKEHLEYKQLPILRNCNVPNIWIESWSPIGRTCVWTNLNCKSDPVQKNSRGPNMWTESWRPTRRTCICSNIWNVNGFESNVNLIQPACICTGSRNSSGFQFWRTAADHLFELKIWSPIRRTCV